mmetsp:Transcript_811/g.1909  ORF Transcript_811/g.1909 Transcript_811/m.1909 type:complete len:218 (-) Transcript_811:395-1048(-)
MDSEQAPHSSSSCPPLYSNQHNAEQREKVAHEHLIGGLHKLDAHIVLELRKLRSEILMEQVCQLSSILNTGRSSSHHHKAQQLLAVLRTLSRIARALEGIDDGTTDRPGVLHLLEEVRVLLDSRGVEGVVVRAHRHHQLVVRHLELRASSGTEVVAHAAGELHARGDCVDVACAVDERQQLVVLVKARALRLDERHMRADGADGLDDRARLNGTHSN